MFDERHYSAMPDESEEAAMRMHQAQEVAGAEASSDEAKDFVENYARELSAKLSAGELTNDDLDLLEDKIKNLRESQGH